MNIELHSAKLRTLEAYGRIGALQIENLRYSRVQLCATGQCPDALKMLTRDSSRSPDNRSTTLRVVVTLRSPRMSDTAKLLSELIALPSVNPAFLPAGDVRAGEQRVADFLAATAARAGLEVEFQPVLPGRANLIARLQPSRRASRTIVLAPHLDTVPAADDRQFTPQRKGGRIFGRGACDTKGSAAAMISALGLVAKAKQRPRETEIIFAGLVDEESAQAGSRALAASKLKADLAIVGEPTSEQVVTAHKGNIWLQIETRGKSAHGSRPEVGRNAIYAMARVVSALETDYSSLLRKRGRHPLLGAATVSVGTICGGTQPNIVPNSCVIALDRRTLPGERDAGVKREIAGFLARKKLPASLLNGGRLVPCRPMEIDAHLPLVRQFMKSTGQRGPAGVNYFCDAAVLAEGGIPSVVFGPGDIAYAHRPDEWISLRSLERARDILVRFLSLQP